MSLPSGTLEIIGWIGAVMYIVAYLLLTLGKLKSDSFIYHFMNVLGAMGLIVNAFHFDDYPNVVTNLLWLAIGALALITMVRKGKSRQPLK